MIKVLKIILFPVTLAASILVGAILGGIGMVVYCYTWTFKAKELWKTLQK